MKTSPMFLALTLFLMVSPVSWAEEGPRVGGEKAGASQDFSLKEKEAADEMKTPSEENDKEEKILEEETAPDAVLEEPFNESEEDEMAALSFCRPEDFMSSCTDKWTHITYSKCWSRYREGYSGCAECIYHMPGTIGPDFINCHRAVRENTCCLRSSGKPPSPL